jgi:hypothetical protein
LSVAEPKYFNPFALAKVLSWQRAAGKRAARSSRPETCIVAKKNLEYLAKKNI